MQLSDLDRKALWGKSGDRCSYNMAADSCDRELIRIENGRARALGEECHIVGDKPTSARYIEDFTDRETYSNAILMCGYHHKLIDDSRDIYSIDVLREMKARHEDRVREALESGALQPLIIEDSEFLTIVENAQKAVGMEVNRPAQLSNVKSELRASNVQEAIGFLTNQGLTATLMPCECGRSIPMAFTGPPPAVITCPHCGREHRMRH